VSLLLAADDVALYPPGKADAHGWVEPGAAPYWCGTGNLQLAPGASDPAAAGGGGHGPADPAAAQGGVLYLPAGCGVWEGSTARIRGQWWALSQVRLVTDPAHSGLDCVAATATGRRRDG
jgi:hypothetical protein